jgi:hypothetical protein
MGKGEEENSRFVTVPSRQLFLLSFTFLCPGHSSVQDMSPDSEVIQVVVGDHGREEGVRVWLLIPKSLSFLTLRLRVSALLLLCSVYCRANAFPPVVPDLAFCCC